VLFEMRALRITPVYNPTGGGVIHRKVDKKVDVIDGRD